MASRQGGSSLNFVHIIAQTAWYEPNYRYQTLLESIQENARQSQAGIWGLPISESCELANHGNGLGEGSPECEGREG